VILSDGGIRKALTRLENPLIIDPPFHPDRLQPASLELTLAADVLMEVEAVWWDECGNRHTGVRMDPLTLCLPQCAPSHHVVLRNTDFWLASTAETVRIPDDMVAVVNGKSSLGRLGLVVHQTAGFIDPGFRGQITLELTNVSRKPIKLVAGMPICQLVFMKLDSPAERPYGTPGLGSHYQGQRGPTPSRA
jgi:dCTP deaminase